jgi:hypothetical protein
MCCERAFSYSVVINSREQLKTRLDRSKKLNHMYTICSHSTLLSSYDKLVHSVTTNSINDRAQYEDMRRTFRLELTRLESPSQLEPSCGSVIQSVGRSLRRRLNASIVFAASFMLISIDSVKSIFSLSLSVFKWLR